MSKHVPVDIHQMSDGSYVLRLTITTGRDHRYESLLDVWRALDAIDNPSAPEAALAA